jgi:trimeric autotransporter adhesin
LNIFEKLIFDPFCSNSAITLKIPNNWLASGDNSMKIGTIIILLCALLYCGADSQQTKFVQRNMNTFRRSQPYRDSLPTKYRISMNREFKRSGFHKKANRASNNYNGPLAGLSQPGDTYWDTKFAYGGISGQFYAASINGSDVYIGGNFEYFPGSTFQGTNVAKWNGSAWMLLSSGFNGVVNKIVFKDGKLYVAGSFDSVGSVGARRIAVWNGSTWSALGNGVNREVFDIRIDGSTLYAGGRFDTAGSVQAYGIAKWDGSNWSTIGAIGVDGNVFSIEVMNGQLYVGGDFYGVAITVPNFQELPFIARWDGSAWHSVGEVLDGPVRSMIAVGTTLCVGGWFQYAGSLKTGGLAIWNGTNWSRLGSIVYGYVESIMSDNGNLYIGGDFSSIGSLNLSSVAKWNGSTWSKLGYGSDGSIVFSVAANGSNVYICGEFMGVSDDGTNVIESYGVGKWNGTSWGIPINSVGFYGFNDAIGVITVDGDTIYVGGTFLYAGVTQVNYIAKWNGSSWIPLSGGTNGPVSAIAVDGSNIYVGGSFTKAGNVTVNNIAKWDGNTWSALGTGTNNGVGAIAVHGTDIYVGGLFTTAGGTPANYIAKWNGGTWSALADGLHGNSYSGVNDIVVNGTNVVVGGNFTSAGTGITVNNIAKWDGSAWSGFGNGLTGSGSTYDVGAWQLCIRNGKLYAVGKFDSAGGILVNNIAMWDGVQWSDLGKGLGASYCSGCFVASIVPSGNDLYVTGQWYANGVGNNLARWNGNAWSAVGSGITFEGGYAADGYSLFIEGNNLYVGGGFERAGETPAWKFARWSGLDPLYVYPDHFSFSGVDPGNSALDTVVMKNISDAAITISDVHSTNGEFTVQPGSAVINVGDSAEFYCTFTPLSRGTRVGTIEFLNNGIYSTKTVVASNVEAAAITINVNSGWNLVSAPLITADMRKTSLFQHSVSEAYSYESGYHAKDTINNMTGYWLKYSSIEAIDIFGFPFTDDTLEVSEGWNLIGSITNPIEATSITSAPPGIFNSICFTYQSGYKIADSLYPGKGYWVKSAQNGKLIFSSTAHSRSSVVSPKQSAISTYNKISITDAANRQQVLYFGNRNAQNDFGIVFTMPPLPPTGVFDARFSTNNLCEFAVGVESREIPIVISSAQFPVQVSWDISADICLASLVIGDQEVTLDENESFEILNPGVSLTLKIISAVDMPKEFALVQNYPNPFNPVTTIRYQLPVESKVSLRIFNVLGQEVGLVVGTVQAAGYKSFEWNSSGHASGVYFYRLDATGVSNPSQRFSQTRKMVLVR